MGFWRLVGTSLGYHRSMHTAVACGVAVAAAVLTGALVVGDSMRGSLRALVVERLGRVDQALVADRFFRAALADELAAHPEFHSNFTDAVPVILLDVSLQHGEQPSAPRANRVQLIGCDERFWRLGQGGLASPLADRQIALSEPVAERLGVKPGQRVLLRLPVPNAVPSESALGRKQGTVRSYPVTVAEVIGAEGLGRFNLQPDQQWPRNAYVRLAWLQDRLQRPGQANAILVAARDAQRASPRQSEELLARIFQPKLEDYGIHVRQTARGYFNITTDRMILDPAAESQILQRLAGLDEVRVQPSLVYLANTIGCGDRQVPYSTVAAVDFVPEPPLGPMESLRGEPLAAPGPGQIVLNQWAAEQLQALPGSAVRVVWFEPESTDGRLREVSRDLRVSGIVRLEGAAADPAFTPEVPGVTDEEAIADWDPPFPFDAKRIRPEDEAYWKAYRATPKAFLSLQTGREFWASRFGQTTSLRVAPRTGVPADQRTGMTANQLAARLALDPRAMGFTFQPVKRLGLEASQGTTPFSVLFLGFSMFLIAAAVILTALLFRLVIDRRAGELGILLALGWTRTQVVGLLVAEGLTVAVAGSLLGTLAGIGYAALMLLGLQTVWLPAIVTPFLRLYFSGLSLLVGWLAGVVVAGAAIVWSVWVASHRSPRQLLAGQPGEAAFRRTVASRAALDVLAVALVISAVGAGIAALWLGEAAQALAFFGAGALVLAACVLWLGNRLRWGATGRAVKAGRGNLMRMAARSAARNPTRSGLTIGLVAAACFLVVAIGAFRQDPTRLRLDRRSGNGGFSLVAESDQPVYLDLNDPAARTSLGFSDGDSAAMGTARVYSFRVKPGENATCLNLYRPRQPRVLGVPEALIRRGGFVFAATQRSTASQPDNPWRLLGQDLAGEADGVPRVPVVMDDATAKYSLGLSGRPGETLDIHDARGRTIRLVVVALLQNSIFQGDLLMAEPAFRRFFPEVNGFRFFLVECPPDEANVMAGLLERQLGDYGLAAQTTGQRLAQLLAVQNTYLSTFQSLGGLGLLLGTLGLGAVQLRNLVERRSELALLRAVGFRRHWLVWLVLAENGLLLGAGLGSGIVAALCAVLPHLLLGGATMPWGWLFGMLLAVALAGLGVGWVAGRAVLKAPLLPALRAE